MSDERNTQEEAASFRLAKEEAVSFVEGVLLVPFLERDTLDGRLALLDSLIYAMHQKIPFQTIYRCSIPFKDRHRPSFAVIKHNMFQKYGGTCETIQPFFKCLLDALGYQTSFFPASVLGSFEGHVGIIVHDLKYKGSRHIVEVGCKHPTFTAIPLDFEVESEIYSVSYASYKYVRRPDGMLDWLLKFQTKKNEWFKFAVLNTTKLVDISYFFEKQEADQTNLEIELNRSVWASHYKGNCFFWVRGSTLSWNEKQEQELLKKEIGTKEELKEILQSEFPQFPSEMINLSFSNTELVYDESYTQTCLSQYNVS